MTESLIQYGYTGMFLLSMLASSILPLGSEWLLVALILKGFDPVTTTAVASAGNLLGAVTTYAIGYFGSDYLTNRILKIDDQKKERAEKLYNKYGAYSLLLSWLPVIGDPICFASGVAKYSILKFTVLTLSGKAARYAFVAYMTLKAI